MDLNKLLAQVKERQGDIRKIRADLNAEEVRLFRIRDKIYERAHKKEKEVQHGR